MHGKESFLMARYTNDFEAILAKEYGEVDRMVFDGATTDLATILDEVRTFDLMMQHKLVIVDNADAFLAAKGTGKTSNPAVNGKVCRISSAILDAYVTRNFLAAGQT